MISTGQKFIFLHIPKTGGCSVIKCLESYCDVKKFKWGHPTFGGYYRVFNYHKWDINDYKIFTFVRNPYDRLVSTYNYLKAGGTTPGDRKIRDSLNLFTLTFEEFVHLIADTDTRGKIQHCLPQVKFIEPEQGWDKINIFRFENINNDFTHACEYVGIGSHKLPHLNKSKHTHYTEYYNDSTRKLVHDIYKEDIEAFNYTCE